MVECKLRDRESYFTSTKEADGEGYNLEKLEPGREDSRASLITVPVKNTGSLLSSPGETARNQTSHG